MGAKFWSRRRYDEVFFVDNAIDIRKKWDGLFVLQEGELLDEDKGGALNCTSPEAHTKPNDRLHAAGDKVR